MSKYLSELTIHNRYKQAQYQCFGVDPGVALAQLKNISISLHCWQGDDVGGFEVNPSKAGNGNPVTGAHPGKARNPKELQDDLSFTYKMLPGKHRLNLHSIYADTDGLAVDRTELEPKHFISWLNWANDIDIKLDFNPTLFAHENAKDDLTLSHPEAEIRSYWIQHCKATRHIADYLGRELDEKSINCIWAVDEFKDTATDKFTTRRYLQESLDEIFKESLENIKDAVEGKLFGIGTESCVIGSNEFYLGYAISRKKMQCYDLGYFHPTESVADKLSAVLLYLDEMLLHVSRPVRWDSDHVVTLNDDLLNLCHELVRGRILDRVNIALDYFDASINRVAAWIIGTRNTQKALLISLLENSLALQEYEQDFNFTDRLALMEEYKSLDLKGSKKKHQKNE